MFSVSTLGARRFSCVSVFILRAVFNRMSKVIAKLLIGFALPCYMIGLKISRHLLNQSDAKRKPTATWSHVFSRASRRLRVFATSSHWFILLLRLL